MGLSVDKLKKIVNKDSGFNVAYDLRSDESPNVVKDWISTGSLVLDCTIAPAHIVQGSKVTTKVQSSNRQDPRFLAASLNALTSA